MTTTLTANVVDNRSLRAHIDDITDGLYESVVTVNRLSGVSTLSVEASQDLFFGVLLGVVLDVEDLGFGNAAVGGGVDDDVLLAFWALGQYVNLGLFTRAADVAGDIGDLLGLVTWCLDEYNAVMLGTTSAIHSDTGSGDKLILRGIVEVHGVGHLLLATTTMASKAGGSRRSTEGSGRMERRRATRSSHTSVATAAATTETPSRDSLETP